MTQLLRQSTAADILLGPFEDSTNGYSPETGLSPSVKLSKNGQTLAAKNDATTPVHDADGYYNCELDATDTNTVGTLVVTVVGSATSLSIRHEYQVVTQAAYDFMYGSSADPDAAINAECDTALSDYNAVVPADLPANFADLAITATTGRVTVGTNNDKTGYSISGTKTTLDALNDVSAANVNAECDTALTDYDAATGAELSAVETKVDSILTDTGTTIPAQITSEINDVQTDIGNLNDLTSANVGDAVLDEVYEGTTTLRQFLRLAAATLFGKASGLATTTAAYRDEADTKDRISATVDADGNRTAVTLNKT